jgi:two-component system chemotaxis response regulator CheY
VAARQRNAIAWPSPDRPLRAVGGSDAHGHGDEADGPSPLEASAAEAATDNPALGATVLIVDDERDIRFLLRFVLEKSGYRVVEAVHGASALDLIRDERPALVITDLMMPVMDGGELIGSLRGADGTAQIPAILVSACPERAPKDRFDVVMRKPFLPSELVTAVHELMAKRADG